MSLIRVDDEPWWPALLVITATIMAVCIVTANAVQRIEGAMGSYPVPPVVAMTGQACGADAHILTTGPLSAADHEAAEGYFTIQSFSIAVPRDSITATVLRERRQEKGAEWEILIRRRPTRTLDTISKEQ